MVLTIGANGLRSYCSPRAVAVASSHPPLTSADAPVLGKASKNRITLMRSIPIRGKDIWVLHFMRNLLWSWFEL
jgi:hypothetical protein